MKHWKQTIVTLHEKTDDKTQITNPVEVTKMISEILKSEKHTAYQEHFWIIGLDNQNRCKMLQLVSLGGLSATMVDPRVVFFALLSSHCSGFIAVHNHPSANCNPSQEDEKVNKQLSDGAALLGFRMLDFLIVSDDKFYSFSEMKI